MSFRALLRGYALALVCGAASLLMARGQGQPPATLPPTNGVSIPAQRPPPKDRLKDLEDELSKALESISPKGMLDAKPQYHPSPIPTISNRRLKEEREKRKNWMFQETDDLLRDNSTPNSTTDWLNPSDTKDGKKKTDLDLFYERLNQQRSLLNQKGHLNPNDLTPLSGPSLTEQSSSDKGDKLPDFIKGAAGRVRDLLGSNPSTVTAPHNTLSDFLHPSQNTLTPEQVQAHKTLMDEYRRILASSTPAFAVTSPRPTAGNSSPQIPSLPSSSPIAIPSTPGMVGSIYNPSMIMPDRNATLLNQWNPLYAPPKVEPPKPPPIIEPPIEAPRRKF
jgi:hypothetical protein